MISGRIVESAVLKVRLGNNYRLFQWDAWERRSHTFSSQTRPMFIIVLYGFTWICNTNMITRSQTSIAFLNLIPRKHTDYKVKYGKYPE